MIRNFFRKPRRVFTLVVVLVLLIGGAWLARRFYYSSTGQAIINRLFYGSNGEEAASNELIYEYLVNPANRAALSNSNAEACPNAPFILPSAGLVGLLWRDPAPPYTNAHRHTGIDVFGDGASGTVPVVAVYDGWLTRQDDWKSTVIIQHADPLHEGEIIWTYYTHMANLDGSKSYIEPDFPPATYLKFVKQGTLLGYQGDFAGAGANPIAMHVHMSIVGTDATGAYLNEGILENTIDPSPYFGMALNIDDKSQRPIPCVE